MPARGATGGALWGGLIGLLFLASLFGMATGAVAGKMRDVGVNDGLMKELATEDEEQLRAALGQTATVCPTNDRLPPAGRQRTLRRAGSTAPR